MPNRKGSSEAITSSDGIDNGVILQDGRIDGSDYFSLHDHVGGDDGGSLAAQFEQHSQIGVLGNEFTPDLSCDGRQVHLSLLNHDGAVQSQEFGLVGGDVGDIVQQFLGNGVISASAVQNDGLPLRMCVLGGGEIDPHGYFLLKQQVLRLINHLPEVFLQLLSGEVHIGSSKDDDAVLSALLDSDVSHAGMFSLQYSPVQLNVSCTHLLLQFHLRIVLPHLSQEQCCSCQFSDRDGLVGPLTAVGCEVTLRLDGLSDCGDLLDVEEVVGVGTPQDADLLAALHIHYKQLLSNCRIREDITNIPSMREGNKDKSDAVFFPCTFGPLCIRSPVQSDKIGI